MNIGKPSAVARLDAWVRVHAQAGCPPTATEQSAFLQGLVDGLTDEDCAALDMQGRFELAHDALEFLELLLAEHVAEGERLKR